MRDELAMLKQEVSELEEAMGHAMGGGESPERAHLMGRVASAEKALKASRKREVSLSLPAPHPPHV